MASPGNEELSEELVLIAVKLIRRLRGLDPSPALTRAEASVLAVLVFAGELTMGELARQEGVKAPTMTRQVQNLERRGLVRRQADSADARITRIAITASGRKLFVAGQKRLLTPLVELLRSFDRSELATLISAMPVLRKVANVGGRRAEPGS